MKVTRQIVADKIADYLHGKVSQAELVDWAEGTMMDAEFDDLLREHRTFAPPVSFRNRARIKDEQIYTDAERDPEARMALEDRGADDSTL